MADRREGKYFIVDGVGGSGKTTVIRSLVTGLKSREYEVIETREPGGTPASEKGREVLFEMVAEKLLYGDQQVAIFNLLRRITIRDVVIPGVVDGKLVVSDRGFPATLAYQISDVADLERTDSMTKYAIRGIVPAAIFILNVGAENAMLRRKPNDPFDERGVKLLESSYRKLSSSL